MIEEIDIRQLELCLIASEVNQDFTILQDLQELSLQEKLISVEADIGTRD